MMKSFRYFNVKCDTMQFSIHLARIYFYKIPQGQQYSADVSWLDTKYSGKATSKKELTGGKGCLVDESHGEGLNALKTPYCWVGWNKTNVSNPSIHITLSRLEIITGIYLRTYVNEDIGASTIKKFTVKTTKYDGNFATINGYACAPKSNYHISPQVIDYEIDLGKTEAQYVTLSMEYSGNWILVRQVMVKQGTYILSIFIGYCCKYFSFNVTLKLLNL